MENIQTELDQTFLHEPEKTTTYQEFEKITTLTQSWIDEILNLGVTQQQLNSIFKLSADMFKKTSEIKIKLLHNDHKLDADEVIAVSTDLICNRIAAYDSTYKYKKTFSNNELFVAPREIAIGTRWELKRCKNTNIAIPKLIQSKFQYISIVETIVSLFKRPDFKEAYFKFNGIGTPKEHVCKDGEFNYFCCGSVFKKSELYKYSPESLQIQICSDDVEFLNPLQPKAGVHKVCAIYLSI